MSVASENELDRFLSRKPEMVTGFPRKSLAEARESSRGRVTCLVEIAGRDSIAAALEVSRDNRFQVLIPTIVYTGTEVGDWESFLDNTETLRSLLEIDQGPRLTSPIFLGSPMWWRALSARFAGLLGSAFGFYTFCVACHMYMHTVRIPIARQLGAGVVVSGERESHGDRIKINQTRPAITSYRDVCEEYGVELRTPLQYKRMDEEIAAIIGADWKEGERQLECVLSSNYRGTEGEVLVDESQVQRYLDEYLVPAASALVKGFMEDPDGADFESIVSGYLPLSARGGKNGP